MCDEDFEMARKSNGKVESVVVDTTEQVVVASNPQDWVKDYVAPEQVVETTPEVVEMNTEQAENTNVAEQVETQVEVENQTAEVATETAETEEVDELAALKEQLDELNVDGLKSIITHCEFLIEQINRDAVEALEAEMRAIQDKLWALKGGRRSLVLEESARSDSKKVGRPIVNPNNPQEVWGGFGARPDWLNEMIKSAKGDRKAERELLNKIREEQAKTK